MRALDVDLTKELRRCYLALSFLRRHVRTNTICEWTGLSRARVDKIRKAHVYEFPAQTLTRPSGPAPEKLCEFLRSPRMRSEAAALGGLCRAFGAIPLESVPDARRYLPSVSRGEHLCWIYDLYRALVPSAAMTVEQLISLVTSLADGESHEIGKCLACSAAILVDPLGRSRRICMHCKSSISARVAVRNEAGGAGTSADQARLVHEVNDSPYR